MPAPAAWLSSALLTKIGLLALILTLRTPALSWFASRIGPSLATTPNSVIGNGSPAPSADFFAAIWARMGSTADYLEVGRRAVE
jgi:hypothetical protein